MKGWRLRADSIGPVGSHLTIGLRRLSGHMLFIAVSGIYAVSSESATAEPVAAPASPAAAPTSAADASTAPSPGGLNAVAGASESDENTLPVVTVTAQKRK